MQTSIPDAPTFLDAFQGLQKGDFSRLEPIFIGEVTGASLANEAWPTGRKEIDAILKRYNAL